MNADEPTKCTRCGGEGREWRYRLDDRRYPVPCAKCGGSGVDPGATP